MKHAAYRLGNRRFAFLDFECHVIRELRVAVSLPVIISINQCILLQPIPICLESGKSMDEIAGECLTGETLPCLLI